MNKGGPNPKPECKPRPKVFDLHPKDEQRSSVKDEINAMDYPLRRILEAVGKIQEYNNLCNDHEIDAIRQAVNKIAQRGYRAEQCSRGLKVYKA